MTQETFYTIKEATELYGLPNITQLWISGKFPNAILGEDKTVRIPKSDLDKFPSVYKQPEPAPPDTSKIIKDAEDNAARIKSEADAYVAAIKAEADIQYADTIKQAETELQDKRAELTRLTTKIDDLTKQSHDLQEAKNLCLQKYNEIRDATKQNISYHNNIAQRDRWGIFLDWMETQFRIK